MRSWDVLEESVRKSLKILCLRSYADLERPASVEPIPADCDVVPCELSLDELDEKAEVQKKLSKEKQQAGNRGRSELRGTDHKQARSEIRSQLQQGYYISHSGKKAIGMVHCLGRCYMLPGVDYLSFSYAGVQFPASDEYDSVCEDPTIKGRYGVFRYEHFVVFRRVSLPCESSANFLLDLNDQRPRLSEPAQRAQVQRTKNEGQRPSRVIFCLKCPGRFWWGTKGFHTEIGFPHCWHDLSVPENSARARNLCNLSLLRSRLLCDIQNYGYGSVYFDISIPAAKLADAPLLEPAFEHLLRNSPVHESVIGTLRVNAITDRETFVFLFDSEAALKEGASDLGFDLTTGGLPHKREFARVVTSWKTAKVMSETKLQTDAVARAHGVPVTLLPCDWTSLLTEFKNKFGKHIPDDKLPAQSMFENFSERLADGTLKADVVSLFEEEQQDAKRPDPTRQYNLQLDSEMTATTKRRHLSSEPTDEKGTPPQVFDSDQPLAARTDAAARALYSRRF